MILIRQGQYSIQQRAKKQNKKKALVELADRCSRPKSTKTSSKLFYTLVLAFIFKHPFSFTTVFTFGKNRKDRERKKKKEECWRSIMHNKQLRSSMTTTTNMRSPLTRTLHHDEKKGWMYIFSKNETKRRVGILVINPSPVFSRRSRMVWYIYIGITAYYHTHSIFQMLRMHM